MSECTKHLWYFFVGGGEMRKGEGTDSSPVISKVN